MTNKNKKLKTERLSKMVDQLVRDIKPYDPEKIILFGSASRNEMRKNSDIDLLVVKKTRKSMMERMRDVRKLIYKNEYYGDERKFPGPVDVIVYTPAQIKRELKLGDFFIEEIVKQGKIIYERKLKDF